MYILRSGQKDRNESVVAMNPGGGDVRSGSCRLFLAEAPLPPPPFMVHRLLRCSAAKRADGEEPGTQIYRTATMFSRMGKERPLGVPLGNQAVHQPRLSSIGYGTDSGRQWPSAAVVWRKPRSLIHGPRRQESERESDMRGSEDDRARATAGVSVDGPHSYSDSIKRVRVAS